MLGDSGPAPEIRPAQVDDTPAILHFWSLARSPLTTTDDDPGALKRLAADDASTLFLAQLDEAIVGTVIAAWDGWRGHIYRLAVAPEYRRQGIGRRLVECGHQRLRLLGATRVNTAVGESEPGPIAFWRAIGYSPDPGMSRFAKSL